MKNYFKHPRVIYRWNTFDFLRRKLAGRALSNKRWIVQVLGYIIYQVVYLAIALIVPFLFFWLWKVIGPASYETFWHWLGEIFGVKSQWFAVSTLAFLEVVWIVKKLTPIFSIRREEIKITVSQIFILLAFGAWLLSIIFILRIDNYIDFEEKKYALMLAAVGTLLTWIFQDTIKSVVAFLYVRLNGMVNIGDWIKVGSKNIDGRVKKITLTMVTIENWDTTETSFPTSLLHSDSFTNLQSMLDGKTHGRRMLMTFTLDTGWIQPISVEEAVRIAEKLDTDDYFKQSEFVDAIREAQTRGEEVMNVHLFRLYIFHWLMNHKKVCRRPRLIVRYQQPSENGLPLQVYAYLTEITLETFEWTQSGIVEHILESMKWFNLRLYQSASAFDVSNSNIYIAPESAKYKNKVYGTPD